MRDKPLIEEFINETEIRIESLEEALLQFEKEVSQESLNTIFIDIHSIKGICGFYNFTQLEIICHQSEELIKGLQANLKFIEKRHIDLLLQTIDTVKEIIQGIYINKSESAARDSLLINQLKLTAAELLDTTKDTPKITHKEPLNEFQKKALESLKKLKPESEKETSDFSQTNQINNNYIRVDINTIKKISGLIEETKLMKSQIINVNPRHLGSFSTKLNIVLDELQQEVTKLQQEPVNSLINKFHRLTRNIANQLDKKVELTYQDNNLKVDRSLLNLMFDPLLHIIRNSIDHGIESPEERKLKGKDETGKIQIQVKHHVSHIQFIISDDGKGLSKENIKRTALAKNLYTSEELESMSDSEIYSIIITENFSTKQESSMFSGRGVGMSAIKKNAESIFINSIEGQGTTITIKMASKSILLTGVEVKVAGESYLINTSNILSTQNLQYSDISLTNNQAFIEFKKQKIPIIHSKNFFNFESQLNKKLLETLISENSIPILILQIDQLVFALAVEAIENVHEYSLRKFKLKTSRVNKFLGTALIGSDNLMFVLNINSIRHRLINTFNTNFNLRQEDKNHDTRNSHSYIACSLGSRRFLFSINKDSHIKTYDTSEIQTSSSIGKYISTNNKSIKLIDLFEDDNTSNQKISTLYQKDLNLCFTIGQTQELYLANSSYENNEQVNINDLDYRFIDISQYQYYSFGKALNEVKPQIEENSFKVIYFEKEKTKFAIRLESIQEVLQSDITKRIPIEISHCEGILNHRGNSILCKDISRILGLKKDSTKKEPWKILIKENQETEPSLAISLPHEPLIIDLYEKDKVSNYQNSLREELKAYTQGVYQAQDSIVVVLEPKSLFPIEDFVISM